MQVGKSVIFAGFNISSDGIHPIEERIAAIKNFPTPKTTTNLKSFLGLANQLGRFVPDLTHSVNALRGLLRKNVAWQWLPDPPQISIIRANKIFDNKLETYTRS